MCRYYIYIHTINRYKHFHFTPFYSYKSRGIHIFVYIAFEMFSNFTLIIKLKQWQQNILKITLRSLYFHSYHYSHI